MAKKMMNINKEWEERFNNEFRYIRDGQWCHMIDAYDENDVLIGEKTSRAYMVPSAIKDFIRTLRLQALEQCRNEGEEGTNHNWYLALTHLTVEQREKVLKTYEELCALSKLKKA